MEVNFLSEDTDEILFDYINKDIIENIFANEIISCIHDIETKRKQFHNNLYNALYNLESFLPPSLLNDVKIEDNKVLFMYDGISLCRHPDFYEVYNIYAKISIVIDLLSGEVVINLIMGKKVVTFTSMSSLDYLFRNYVDIPYLRGRWLKS